MDPVINILPKGGPEVRETLVKRFGTSNMRHLKVPCWKLLFFLGTGQRVCCDYEMFSGDHAEYFRREVMTHWVKRLRNYDGSLHGHGGDMKPPPSKAEMKAGAGIIADYLETCLEHGHSVRIDYSL